MRLKIAIRNLLISESIIIVFLIFSYFIWFPYSFSELGGYYKTAAMLIFVDLILGPLLVFFIYREGKKYLAFDINVLLSIQLVAFVFGAYSLFLKHPAYAVFINDRFILTNVSHIYPQTSLWVQMNQHIFSSTEFVVAKIPKDTNEKNNLIIDVVINGQPDIQRRPEYFSPLANNIDDVMKRSIQLDQLLLDSSSQKKLGVFREKHGNNIQDYAFFPLRGNNQKDVIWVLDKKTAKPITILDIDPWKVKVASNQL